MRFLCYHYLAGGEEPRLTLSTFLAARRPLLLLSAGVSNLLPRWIDRAQLRKLPRSRYRKYSWL